MPEADGRFLPSYTRVVVVVVAVVHAGRSGLLPSYTRVVVVVVAVVHTGRSGDRQRAVSVLCLLVFGFWNFFRMKFFWCLLLVICIGV